MERFLLPTVRKKLVFGYNNGHWYLNRLTNDICFLSEQTFPGQMSPSKNSIKDRISPLSKPTPRSKSNDNLEKHSGNNRSPIGQHKGMESPSTASKRSTKDALAEGNSI